MKQGEKPRTLRQEQRPIHDARKHIASLLEPARKRALRKLLEQKTKSELIDAMFDMVHLPDLLDYFRAEVEHRL